MVAGTWTTIAVLTAEAGSGAGGRQMNWLPVVSRASAKLRVPAGKPARPVMVTRAAVSASTAGTVRSNPVIEVVFPAAAASVAVKAAAALWLSPTGEGGGPGGGSEVMATPAGTAMLPEST